MFHPKTCPWNTRNSNSSLLSARLQRQKTISEPRGTGLWSRDVLHLLTNDVMKLCRDNCHALAWNDWNDWVLLYLIPLIYIYIIIYHLISHSARAAWNIPRKSKPWCARIFLGPVTDVTFSASASFQSETAEVFYLFHLLFITLWLACA